MKVERSVTVDAPQDEVWRHVLGTPASDDVLVLSEDDERFYMGVERTRSGRFVLIDVSSKLTSEVWFVPTDAPQTEPRVVAPRDHGHEYVVEHHWSAKEAGDRFLIVTNQGGRARNFELVTAPARSFDWQPHPRLGRMSEREWLRWGYLHMDHHLRQFGA